MTGPGEVVRLVGGHLLDIRMTTGQLNLLLEGRAARVNQDRERLRLGPEYPDRLGCCEVGVLKELDQFYRFYIINNHQNPFTWHL